MAWLNETPARAIVHTRARARSCLTMDIMDWGRHDEDLHFRAQDRHGIFLDFVVPKGLIYDPLVWMIKDKVQLVEKVLLDIIQHGGENEHA